MWAGQWRVRMFTYCIKLLIYTKLKTFGISGLSNNIQNNIPWCFRRILDVGFFHVAIPSWCLDNCEMSLSVKGMAKTYKQPFFAIHLINTYGCRMGWRCPNTFVRIAYLTLGAYYKVRHWTVKTCVTEERQKATLFKLDWDAQSPNDLWTLYRKADVTLL